MLKKRQAEDYQSILERNLLYRDILTREAFLSYEIDLTDGIVMSIQKDSVTVQQNGEEIYKNIIWNAAENYVYPDDKQLFLDKLLPENLLDLYYDGQDELSFQFRSCEGLDAYEWLEETVHLVKSQLSGHIYAFLHVKNINERKLQELEFKEQAMRDELTDLYNRRALEGRAQAFIDEKENRAALLLIDLDNFKNVNDVYGHSVGDYVLCYTAKLLQSFAHDWFVCRLGGDEFAIFIPSFRSQVAVAERAQSLCRFMKNRFGKLKYENNLSCSIGVAYHPEHAGDYFSLYEKADIAQYRAKRLGKNRSCVFSMQPSNMSELNIVNVEWLMNEISDLIYVIDCENYDILYCNRAFADAFDVNMRNFYGRKCYEAIHGSSSPCEECFCRKLDENNTFITEIEYTLEGVTYKKLARGRVVNWGVRQICIISLMSI